MTRKKSTRKLFVDLESVVEELIVEEPEEVTEPEPVVEEMKIIPTPEEDAIWNDKVLNSFSKTCAKCGSKDQVEVHRIVNDPEKRHELSNGIVLCKLCGRGFDGQTYVEFMRN